jgi:hypothetical protein
MITGPSCVSVRLAGAGRASAQPKCVDGVEAVTALTDVALQRIERHGAIALRVAAAGRGSLLAFGRGEDLHHDDQAEHADDHGDHHFNQSEASCLGHRGGIGCEFMVV